MSLTQSTNLSELEKFLLKDAHLLIENTHSEQIESDDSKEVSNSIKEIEEKYLGSLLTSSCELDDGWSDEDSNMPNSPRLSEPREFIVCNQSDKLIKEQLKTLMHGAKKQIVCQEILMALKDCSFAARKVVETTCSKQILAFSTNKNATHLVQYLIATADSNGVNTFCQESKRDIAKMVKDIYGFHCVMKLLEVSAVSQKNEIFEVLSTEYSLWKTKNCFLVMSRIVEGGLCSIIGQRFLAVSSIYSDHWNRNVIRLRKLILKNLS